MSAAEGRALLATGTLGEGTMGPKLAAAVEFVEKGGERAVIAELQSGAAALDGSAGTTVQA
jgi:carbamate kinase